MVTNPQFFQQINVLILDNVANAIPANRFSLIL
jgi:hypothetical protein